MRIVVAGASGFLGTALVADLRKDGHDVVRLVRRTSTGSDELTWSPAEGTLGPDALAGADVVVNLSGAGVGDHRWTAAYKRQILRSRVDTTTTLSHAMAAGSDGPKVLLNASAIGFYGDRGDEVLDESSPAGDGFLPDVCRAWEGATQAAEEAGVRVCHLRTGLVLGPKAGLMGRLEKLFRAGLGGKLGSGRQYMSWIALPDEIGAIRFLMDHEIAGPVNLTGPAPVRNAELTRLLGAALGRPTLMPAPRFGLRLVLGEFATDVLSSARVQPEVLLNAGFEHQYQDLASAITWAVAR